MVQRISLSVFAFIALILMASAAFSTASASGIVVDNDGIVIGDHRDPRHHDRGYEWVYTYKDNNGCDRCQFSCHDAPPCSPRWEGYQMACHQAGTNNNEFVYTCERVR